MLSELHVALDIFYQHIVHVYRGVVYNITFDFAMFILRPIRLLSSDSSCILCCSSCGVCLCIGICLQQSGDWREIPRLSSRPCFPSLTF